MSDKVDKSQVIGLGRCKTIEEKNCASLIEDVMETMEIELGIMLNSINLRMRFNEITDELKQGNETISNIMIRGKEDEMKRVL